MRRHLPCRSDVSRDGDPVGSLLDFDQKLATHVAPTGCSRYAGQLDREAPTQDARIRPTRHLLPCGSDVSREGDPVGGPRSFRQELATHVAPTGCSRYAGQLDREAPTQGARIRPTRHLLPCGSDVSFEGDAVGSPWSFRQELATHVAPTGCSRYAGQLDREAPTQGARIRPTRHLLPCGSDVSFEGDAVGSPRSFRQELATHVAPTGCSRYAGQLDREAPTQGARIRPTRHLLPCGSDVSFEGDAVGSPWSFRQELATHVAPTGCSRYAGQLDREAPTQDARMRPTRHLLPCGSDVSRDGDPVGSLLDFRQKLATRVAPTGWGGYEASAWTR